MACKRLTVTVSDWVWNTYIATYKGDNKSKFVEEMFVKGFETTAAELPQNKTRDLEFVQLNRTLKEQLEASLKFIEGLKSKVNILEEKILFLKARNKKGRGEEVVFQSS